MTPEFDLEAVENALRDAITRRDFTAAAANAALYVRAVGLSLPPLAPVTATERLRHAAERLEWAHRNLLAARARIAGQLRATVTIGKPAASPTTALHAWHLDA